MCSLLLRLFSSRLLSLHSLSSHLLLLRSLVLRLLFLCSLFASVVLFCYCCSPFYFLPTLQNAWHGGGGNFDSSVDCDFGVFVVLVPVAVVDLVALVAVQLMAVVVVELAAVESMMESGRGIIRMRRNWQWRNWWLCFPH